jgi:hypothetical protein
MWSELLPFFVACLVGFWIQYRRRTQYFVHYFVQSGLPTGNKIWANLLAIHLLDKVINDSICDQSFISFWNEIHENKSVCSYCCFAKLEFHSFFLSHRLPTDRHPTLSGTQETSNHFRMSARPFRVFWMYHTSFRFTFVPDSACPYSSFNFC